MPIVCIRKEVVKGTTCMMGQIDNREQYKIGIFKDGRCQNYFFADNRKDADQKFEMMKALFVIF
jgi:hypothetical protein